MKYIEIWRSRPAMQYNLFPGSPTNTGTAVLGKEDKDFKNAEAAAFYARKRGYIPWIFQPSRTDKVRYL